MFIRFILLKYLDYLLIIIIKHTLFECYTFNTKIDCKNSQILIFGYDGIGKKIGSSNFKSKFKVKSI